MYFFLCYIYIKSYYVIVILYYFHILSLLLEHPNFLGQSGPAQVAALWRSPFEVVSFMGELFGRPLSSDGENLQLVFCGEKCAGLMFWRKSSISTRSKLSLGRMSPWFFQAKKGRFVVCIKFQLLLSGHFLRFIQVGDAYIAGMAEPYLTDQHSAVRVVEFGLAMIKALERFTDEDGVHSSLDTYFTYTCYSIHRYIYICILIIILVILLIFHPTENLQRFGMD